MIHEDCIHVLFVKSWSAVVIWDSRVVDLLTCTEQHVQQVLQKKRSSLLFSLSLSEVQESQGKLREQIAEMMHVGGVCVIYYMFHFSSD